MTSAPIVLFLYNRPDHARRTVEALQRNERAGQSMLFVFCDGPRTAQDAPAVEAVRDFARTITGFAEIHVIERERNLGLSASIIDGVSDICRRFGRVVVLEDDLVTAPHFLRYMNDALDLYAADERVIAVQGYVFPVAASLPETFFLKDPGCWGWATWERGWALFDSDGPRHLAAIRRSHREREFDMDGGSPYVAMLEDQIAGKNNSWAILWYASAFLRGKLTLHPGMSLVQNVGFDGSGTHTGVSTDFAVALADRPVTVAPVPVEENLVARQAISAYLSGLRPSGITRLLRRLARKVRG